MNIFGDSRGTCGAWLCIVLAASPAAFAQATSSGIPPETLTVFCLAGFDSTSDMETACAVVRPTMMEEVRAASRKWKERNAAALGELEKACEARLMKAYKNDRAAISQAKARMRQLQEQSRARVRSMPPSELEHEVNCRAYVEDISAGGRMTDIQPELIQEIWTAPAAPANLPSGGQR